jgi:membrane protein YdbS with pleckstrin-like domain
MEVFSPGRPGDKPQETSGFGAKSARVIENGREEVCLEARRHGIVLVRPLVWAVLLGGAGGVLSTLPWPVSWAGAGLVALAAFVAMRAVWKWERTRVVVTTEKVFVVKGTLRRNAQAVRLRAVEAVELEQTFAGQLLGYGTVIVGPLALEKIPRPKRLYHLVERLAN